MPPKMRDDMNPNFGSNLALEQVKLQTALFDVPADGSGTV
jgi:hypothetical protein